MDNQPIDAFKDNGALDFSSGEKDGGIVDFSNFIEKDVPRETSTNDDAATDVAAAAAATDDAAADDAAADDAAADDAATNDNDGVITDDESDTLLSGSEGDDKKEQDDNIPTLSTPNYKQLFTDLVRDNGWTEVDEIETEEGTVNFEDLEVTEEVFKQLLSAKREEENSKLLDGKIEAKGMSDFTKQLIEIEKEGGSPADVLEMYNKVQAPLDSFDLNKEEDQQAVYLMRLQAQGMDDKTAYKVINASVVAGTLPEDAEESDKMLREAFQSQIDNYQVQVQQANEQRKENLKVYKNAFKDEIGNSFELTTSFTRKIVEAATKPDENGNYQADNIYNEVRKDPVRFAELALYLTDRAEFIKQVTKGELKKDHVKTMSKLKLTSKTKGGNSNEDQNNKPNLGVIELPTGG